MSAAALLLALALSADGLHALAEDGREVILRPDGTYLIEPETAQPDGDFRQAKWGMPPGAVKKAETFTLLNEEKDALAYRGRAHGRDCVALYIFAKGRLAAGRYLFERAPGAQTPLLDDFDALLDTLTDLYGAPSGGVSQLWRAGAKSGDQSRWGEAVAFGELALSAAWQTERTEILLALTGGGGQARLAVEYSSAALEKAVEAIREGEAARDF